MLAKTDEESLVLSRPLCQDTDCTTSRPLRKHILRIRKDMDMSIFVVPVDDAERKRLSEETYNFYQVFNSTCINEHLFPEDPVWPQFERVQSSLYRNVKSDLIPTSVELMKSEGDKQRKKKETDAGTDALYQNTVIGMPKQHSRSQPTMSGNYETLGITKADEFVENSLFWELGRPISPEEDKKEKKEGISEDLLLELMMEVNTANRQMLIQVRRIVSA